MNWIFEKTNVTPPQPNSYYQKVSQKEHPAHVANAAFSHVTREKRKILCDLQRYLRTDEFIHAARPHYRQVVAAYQKARTLFNDCPPEETGTFLRLSFFGEIVPQTLVLPALFRYSQSDRMARLARELFVENMYGKSVRFAADLHREHRHETKGTTKSQQHTVLLHELAFMGIINRSTDGRQCALPTFVDEKRARHDAEFFSYDAVGYQRYVKIRSGDVLSQFGPAPNTILLPSDILGTGKASEPWNSPLMFETLTAMENETKGTECAQGANEVLTSAGLDHVTATVAETIAAQLKGGR